MDVATMNCICLKMRLENECCRGKRLQVWYTNLNRNKCYKKKVFWCENCYLFISFLDFTFLARKLSLFWQLIFSRKLFLLWVWKSLFSRFLARKLLLIFPKKGNIFGVKIVIILGTKIVIFTILVRKLLLSEFWNV